MTDLRGGIDLGGTKIQTAIVDAGGEVLGEARRPTPTDGGPADVAEQMAEALREAAQAAGGRAGERCRASGSAPPATPTRRPASSPSAKNLPDWEGSFPLGENLEKALGTEVRVGNDVQVATEAEFHLGAGREFQSLIGVFWGTGVGGGLVLDGKPWLGRGAAGEIGHMVVKRGGAKCPCGRKGCMEAYAGRSAMEAEARRQHEEGDKTDLFKLMEKHDKPRLTSGIWERALDHGDKLAERPDRPRDRGARHRRRLGGQPDRPGGDHHRRRPRHPLRRALHGAADGGDAQAPLPRRTLPAVRVASLGDLGGAIGASLRSFGGR